MFACPYPYHANSMGFEHAFLARLTDMSPLTRWPARYYSAEATFREDL